MEERKVAIVTGASKGIGAAIAKRLCEDGVAVLINCSSKNSLKDADEVKKECEKVGGKACTFVADVSKFEECEKMVEFAKKEFGRVDFLINNAGVTRDGLLVRMEQDDFDFVLDVNVKGTYNMTKLVAGVMMKQRSGRIVNISSVVGLKGNAGQFNYAASKAAIIGMTKSAAKELGKRGILVNAVAPGFIETKMTDKIDKSFQDKIKENIILKRFGKASEIAGVVSFFCGEDASYITGQVIVVDGCLLI